MQPTTTTTVAPAPPTVSPTRKRSRDAAARATTKLDAPPPRRLRMRLDRSARIWAGRCGCKSPHCMADEFEFSSDTGVSDESDESDGEGVNLPLALCGDDDAAAEDDTQATHPSGSQRPPQDPDDLVPMLLHLMLMM